MATHPNRSTIEPWGVPPDAEVRRTKSIMENELLIRLGVRKEAVEIHPLILSTRLERSKSAINFQYSRVNPPAKEQKSKSRNPWTVQDPALRQLSNPARRGPRDYILPNLVKPPAQIRIFDVPLTDVEYHNRRAAAYERLTNLFSEWTVYNRRAFPQPVSRQATRSDIDPGRKISTVSMVHLAKGQPSRKVSISSTTSSGSSRKKPIRPVPKSRKKKNRWKDMAKEVLLQLQSTHMRLPEELPRSELRIYVSSTPDLQEEREFLEEVAYPKLRDLCEKLGLNCHVVDMRNGAGILTNELETFDLIEKELHNCRALSIGPFFVSLIGHSLDDQTLPGFFPKTVYEEIRETLVREDIIGVEALDDVYRLDSNRVPPVYIKQRICAVEEYQSPEQVERILHQALSKAVSIIRENRDNDGYTEIDFYKWSAVVKEIEEGLLTSLSPRGDTLCFMMDAELAKEAVGKDDDPIRRLRHNVYHHYKHFASKENLLNFKTHRKDIAFLRSMADTFVARVASLLRSQIRHREYDITQQLTEGSEALQHVRIALSETENNSGNDDMLAQLKKIVERTDPSPKTILLWGQSGIGKTAIACQVAKASVLWQPRRKVVFRSLGKTLRSSSLFRVLESLITQLNFLYSLDVELPRDASLQCAVSVFCYTLNAISAKRELHGNILLVLDQLEKLQDLDAHYLLCILNSLGKGTTLILTLRTPHSLMNVLKSHETVQAMTRAHMSSHEISSYVTQNLTKDRRVVTTDQLQSALLALPTEKMPLYAQMTLHLVRWWPSHTLPDLDPCSNTPEADFATFLESIESDLGKAFSRYALSFLASARHGLADQEILHLLSKDSELLDEIKAESSDFVSVVEGFPYQLQLSRLISRLGKFVTNVKVEGESVYQITCQSLVDAIVSKHMGDDFFFTVHERLANFFLFIRRGLLLSSRDIAEQKHKQLSKYHWRTLRCVPYHLCHSSADTAEVWEVLKEKVFYNFSWLINEVYAGFFNDLLDDIGYALNHVSLDPDIQYLQQLLISVRLTVVHNPVSLASVFASQSLDDVHNAKDTVRTVVHEARVWLKQVQLQALVPVSYTSHKSSRLLMKDHSIFEVTDVKPIPGTDRLLVQRNRALFILNMVTCEEVPLATANADILNVYICDLDNVVVLTLEPPSTAKAEVFNLVKGKHIKTLFLTDSPLLWFDNRSLKTSYFAMKDSIKCADLEQGTVTKVMSSNKSWAASTVSVGKPEKVITVQIAEKIKIQIAPVKDIIESSSVSLKKETQNKHCMPVLSTKDGKYILYMSERQVAVIECSKLTVADVYSHNGLPVVNVELSRSHEHIFIAYANGAVTCHVLHTGREAMNTKVKPNPRPQWMTAAKSRDRGGASKNSGDVEVLTTLLTTEDDHFLLCGTNHGHVYVIHVPTGLQLVDINTQQLAISTMTFLTDRGHFQHLITVDPTGLTRHWNLRPLFKQARMILQLYIVDNDLLNEEEIKLDLNRYFTVYEAKRNNRIFLNGPDIASFYQPPPEDIFADLVDLDPAFGVQSDWETTGSIVDLNDHLIALICGNELGDVLLTVSSDFRLARWSLHNGSLIWCRKLPCQGDSIHDIASLYYDQAVLLVEQSRLGQGYGVSVIYTGEGQNKVMSRDNVTCYWASLDRTRLMLMCQGQGLNEDAKLYLWDLINAKEELCDLAHPPPTSGIDVGTFTFTTFSPSLQHNIFLILPSIDGAKPLSADSRLSRPRRMCSAPDPDLDNSAANSASTFDSKHGSPELRPSICDTKMYKSDSRPTSQDLLRSSSGTPEDSPDHVINKENPLEVDLSVTTRIEERQGSSVPAIMHWTEICVGTAAEGQAQLKESRHASGADSGYSSQNSTKVKKSDAPRSQKPPVGRKDSRHPKNEMAHRINDTINEEDEDLMRTDMNNPYVKEKFSQCSLTLQITAVCFVGENDVLVGTNSSRLLMLSLPNFQPVYIFGKEGPKLTDDLSDLKSLLEEATTPHTGAISFVTSSNDAKIMISSDNCVVCLWDGSNQTLNMTIKLEPNQEISQMVISKDAAIIAIATSNRSIRLWTPIEHREVASFMTTFDIVDLQMTSDCRKIIVRGASPENKPILEIFDVRNVDDILMHVASRKLSQQQQTMENLTNERMRRSSRHNYEERRRSLIG